MKIIATTPTGYLVEATGEELANAAGYRSASDVPGAIKENHRWEWSFKVGTTFKPDAAFLYLQELRRHEEKIKSSMSMLRALADMLAGALPTTMIPSLIEDAENDTCGAPIGDKHDR